MSSGERLMVASTFAPVEVGQEFDSLPDHMTWASWFHLPVERREDFAFLMERIVEENRPPMPTAGSVETFGDDSLGRESVRRFDRATRGFNVITDFYAQAALYAFITDADPEFDGKYFGVDWNPHTRASLTDGQEVTLNNLVTFQKVTEHRRKIVRDVYLWGNNQ